MLSDQEDSSDSDHDNDLKINIKYAENYEKVKRQQELRNNKDFLKGNADDDDESESDSESEDDDGIALSTSLDLEVSSSSFRHFEALFRDPQIMKTIESIRNKDPKIYDKKTKWYSSDHSDQESEEDEKKDSKKGSKKKTFKDVIREQLLSTENASDENAANSKLSTLQYDREQEELRKQFLSSANQLSDDSESDAESKGSDDDDLLVAVKKNPKVVAQEEQELLQVISKFEQDEKATAEDLFLANYMKQKKWVDSLSQTLKTTKSKGSEKFMSPEVEDELLDLEEDEQDLVEIDQFESKYNFRFEELQNGLSLSLPPSSLLPDSSLYRDSEKCNWWCLRPQP
jgi:protein KRI1